MSNGTRGGMNHDVGVYLVTDTAQCGARGVVATVQAAVAGGVRMVQVRDKQAAAADLLALVLAVAQAVGDRATVVVDDRVDVYLAARLRTPLLAGVHIGQSDLPVAATRELIGADAVLGLTANTPAHLQAVAALPRGTVDYLGVGAIHATATKPNHPQPLGIDGFADFAVAAELPCVAIGGVSAADATGLRGAGAAGIAVVSAICTAADPGAAARTLNAAWQGVAA